MALKGKFWAKKTLSVMIVVKALCSGGYEGVTVVRVLYW